MKRFSFAILVAFGITTQIHAYELQATSTGMTLRLPPADARATASSPLYSNTASQDQTRSTVVSYPAIAPQPTTTPSRQPAAETVAILPRATEWRTAPPTDESRVGSSSFMPRFQCRDLWHTQLLPDGLFYRPYMASAHECRLAGQWVKENRWGWIWDVALGARVGILRYGNENLNHPEGWQVDMEGAAFPRLQLNRDLDVMSCDYKFGVPLSYARGRHATRFGYYHLSSHLGDEYMIKNPGARRINYSRDCLLLGHSIYFRDRTMRLYAEAAWAFQTGDLTKPWELQFGFEYTKNRPTSLRPEPFFAIGGHLREEVDFGGNLIVQTGLLWQGPTGHMFRMGLQYYVGMSDQYEFIDQYENKIGFGIWYDF